MSAQTAGPDLEGVLRDHAYNYPDSFCSCNTWVGTAPERDYPAHVAAALRAEVRAWLESKVWEGPLTTNRAALAALAEQVAQVAPSRVPGEGS